MAEKLCVLCSHFCIWPGSPGYSEYTPGSDMTIQCGKYHWEMKNHDDGTGQFRRYNQQAETCLDYDREVPE